MNKTEKVRAIEEIISDIRHTTDVIFSYSTSIKTYLDIASDECASESSKEIYKIRSVSTLETVKQKQTLLKELIDELSKYIPLEEF